MTGIDISKHNETFDAQTAKNHIEFVIIRAGYGRETSQRDPKFDEFYSEAQTALIPTGAYWYSYANGVADAQREAQACLQVLNGRALQFPVYFDVEENSIAALGRDTVTRMCIAFCEIIEQGGYFAGIYANTNWWNNYISIDRTNRFTRWLADYRANPDTTIPRDILQYTSRGNVPGVGLASGGVDLNYCTRDFPAEIAGGSPTPQPPPGPVVQSTVDGLRIRNTSNVYGAEIGRLNNGDPVVVLDDLGGGSWIRIQSGNTIGFIARQYTTGANRTNIANDPHVVGQVTANNVALRNMPDKSSRKLATMNAGDVFDVADDRSGDAWIYVRFAGQNGYVARQYTNGANGNNVE